MRTQNTDQVKNQREFSEFLERYNISGRTAAEILGIKPMTIYQMRGRYYNVDDKLRKLKIGYYDLLKAQEKKLLGELKKMGMTADKDGILMER